MVLSMSGTNVPRCTPLRLAARPDRAGLTLLEVLIACGVLALGLASVAALVPVAASRLGQASLEDRVGVVSANAYAEVMNRGLVSARIFVDATKPAVFGKVLPGVTAAGVAVANVSGLIEPSRSFLLEDEVVYGGSERHSSWGFLKARGLVNSFLSSGIREFRQALCWGAMLTPEAFPAAPGGAATLNIAVFRKDEVAQTPLNLVQRGQMYVSREGGSTLLRGCSYVLALPETGSGPPRWYRINSSWSDEKTGEVFVVFADPSFGGFAGSSPRVVGFEGLVRVEQYPVTLE